jgi:hypothetical protein
MAYGRDTEALLQRIKEYENQKDRWLDLACLRIHSLPPFPKDVRRVTCYHTEITSLPPLPEGLEVLECSRTRLTSLPELPSTLRQLFCYNTNIRTLPSLPKSLEILDIHSTDVEILPEIPTKSLAISTWAAPLVLKQERGEDWHTYAGRWNEWHSRQRIQGRTKVFKERLMAATWHPDRFEAWCLDEEEKAENAQLFA